MTMKRFKYQPILPPDEIRMLEIISAEAASDPIQVRLIYRPLSHMPHCIALSYEWGSPTRDFDIICDDKILKVTENLVTALRRLRTFHSQHVDPDMGGGGNLRITEQTLFWIDAISINQEDLDERSQQLGEEREGTSDAWELLQPLSEQVDNFQAYANDDNRERYESTIICPGLMLKDLPQHPAWEDILDIFASRTVFSRLWTLQETCLAPRSQISLLCGSNEMPWDTFSNTASMLWRFGENKRSGIFMNILTRRLLQKEIPLPKKDLQDVLLMAGMHVLVTDQRDRVFGVLGMFGDDMRAAFEQMGYHNSPAEIFRVASEVMVNHGKGLEYLLCVPAVRGQTSTSNSTLDYPSWVWMLEYWRTEDHLHHSEMNNKLPALPREEKYPKPVIQCDELLCHGLIFDTVTVAAPNISPENFDGMLLNMHFLHDIMVEHSSSTKSPPERTFARLRSIYFRMVVTLDAVFDPVEQYKGWIARVMLREWERSATIDGIFEPDFWRGVKLSVLAEQAVLGRPHLDGSLLHKMLRHDQDENLTGEGRNVFITSRGYYGVGVFGPNLASSESAVQIDDRIVVLPGVEQPVVLRPVGNSKYRLVGPAFIPEIEMDELLQQGAERPLELIHIV
ncbi:heterokaryon incompatibility protein-like protein [Calycina marina]|uniref:Heterokaryon incompatibility protein-like protein n=1 Tax=Calycina marina TaxID=1763456 RepID=A0A9P7YWR5_9HELO|nr:heterokaryon incompatibility protein-like protein [Calycina marina]